MKQQEETTAGAIPHGTTGIDEELTAGSASTYTRLGESVYNTYDVEDVMRFLPPTGFEPSGFGESIRRDRYAHVVGDGRDETWEEQCQRVAQFAVSEYDDADEAERWATIYEHVLKNGYMSPAGRVWRNAGTDNPMCDNCFSVGSIGDDRESWANMSHDLIMITALGAGWGADLSQIRPNGAPIEGLGGGQQAGGPENVMELADNIVKPIRSAGNRRAALWLGLDIRHPDIPYFIDMKKGRGNDKYTNMNITVSFFEPPEVFFQAVLDDEEWETSWQHDDDPERTVTGTYDARDLWQAWLSAMTGPGDPAFMNYHRINERYNCSYLQGDDVNDGKIVSCNACSEEPMLKNETCTLSNLVLPRFVVTTDDASPPFHFDYDALKVGAAIQTRFLDDLLDAQMYIESIPEHERMKKKLRRIGNGFMGLAEALVLMGNKYSSTEARWATEDIVKTLTRQCYGASVALAKERTSFPAFNISPMDGTDGFLAEGNFSTRLPTALQEDINNHGIRNSILTNVPPTGTTSLVQGVTGGLEPMYSAVYERTYYNDDDELEKETVVNDLLRSYIDRGWDTSAFENGVDVSPEDQLKMLKVIQDNVDAGTSKTVLVPNDWEQEDIGLMLMEWMPKLSAFTFYQLGSKDDQPITPLPIETAYEHIADAGNEEDDFISCEGGSCEL